jgi:hypothetical protein
MKRTTQEQGIYVLAILFALAPFAFGLIRAFQTGKDFRLLWMAFASCLGALVANAIRKAQSREQNGIVSFSAITFIVATLFAGLTGYLLGATSAIGVWLVALVLGFCWAAWNAFNTLSRPRPN